MQEVLPRSNPHQMTTIPIKPIIHGQNPIENHIDDQLDSKPRLMANPVLFSMLANQYKQIATLPFMIHQVSVVQCSVVCDKHKKELERFIPIDYQIQGWCRVHLLRKIFSDNIGFLISVNIFFSKILFFLFFGYIFVQVSLNVLVSSMTCIGPGSKFIIK